MAAVVQDHDAKVEDENDEIRDDVNDDDAEDELSAKDPAKKKKKKKKKKKGKDYIYFHACLNVFVNIMGRD